MKFHLGLRNFNSFVEDCPSNCFVAGWGGKGATVPEIVCFVGG